MGGFLSWLRSEWDRAAGVGFLLAGAACLVVGYAGVADASYVPQALSFIASGGFFGLLLVAVGATLLITAALHDEWRKLDRIEKAIDRLAAGLPAVDLTGDPQSGNGQATANPAPDPAGGATAHAERATLFRALSAGSAVSAPAAVVTGPVSRRALMVALGGLAAAGALVAGGSAATAHAVADDTAYTTLLLGITGIAVAGIACAGWTLALRRAARARQVRLLEPFRGLIPVAGAGGGAGSGAQPAAGAGRLVAVAEGLTRFHEPECASLRGVAVQLVERAEASRTGLAACGLCQPGPGQ